MVERLDHMQASAVPQVEVVAGIEVVADTATAEAADIEVAEADTAAVMAAADSHPASDSHLVVQTLHDVPRASYRRPQSRYRSGERMRSHASRGLERP